MLRQALAKSLVLLLLTLPWCWAKDSPTISYPELRVDDHSSNSQLLTQKEEDEIVQFVKTVHGNRLLLRKSDDQWTVVERSRWSYPASKDEGIYIWDGTSELAILALVTDAVTHKPISGATVGAVRVGGRNTEPLTNEHPTAMPPRQKTGRDGRVRLVAYFRAAGDAHGFCVFVGDSFLQIDAPGYQSQRVRISPIVRLDFAPKTKHCEVSIPVALSHE